MKYKIISVIMILFVLSVMNGCSSRSRNELSEQVSEITVSSDVSQKDERGYSAESSVPSDVSEEAESSYITENRVPSVVSERVEESIYVTDELFAEGFENKEFYEENVKALLEKRSDGKVCTESPIWLSLALNYMMSLGRDDFAEATAISQQHNNSFDKGLIEYINKQIEEFPANPKNLFLKFFITFRNSFNINII